MTEDKKQKKKRWKSGVKKKSFAILLSTTNLKKPPKQAALKRFTSYFNKLQPQKLNEKLQNLTNIEMWETARENVHLFWICKVFFPGIQIFLERIYEKPAKANSPVSEW